MSFSRAPDGEGRKKVRKETVEVGKAVDMAVAPSIDSSYKNLDRFTVGVVGLVLVHHFELNKTEKR